MKHLVFATLAAVSIALSAAAAAPMPLNTVCPVSGKAANPTITSNYSKTVTVCCDRCVAQFNANPKGYLTNILSASTTQCPLSKKKVDPSKKVTFARKVAFADAQSKAAFDAAPDKFIKEVRQ